MMFGTHGYELWRAFSVTVDMMAGKRVKMEGEVGALAAQMRSKLPVSRGRFPRSFSDGIGSKVLLFSNFSPSIIW